MPLIYRSMTKDGDWPKVGPTAKTLGVRIPGDIALIDSQVSPGSGGMSVAPSWRQLPQHRIPMRLGYLYPDASGKDYYHCWRMGEGPFESGALVEGLNLRRDGPSHALVEPADVIHADDFQARLAATRELWSIDEA